MNNQIIDSKEEEFINFEEPMIIPSKKHLGYDISNDMYKYINSEVSNSTSSPYDLSSPLSDISLSTENQTPLGKNKFITAIKPSKHNPILIHLKMRSKRNSVNVIRN